MFNWSAKAIFKGRLHPDVNGVMVGKISFMGDMRVQKVSRFPFRFGGIHGPVMVKSSVILNSYGARPTNYLICQAFSLLLQGAFERKVRYSCFGLLYFGVCSRDLGVSSFGFRTFSFDGLRCWSTLLFLFSPLDVLF
jgi:hypothetical protein